jgi:cell volume regulation protein A
MNSVALFLLSISAIFVIGAVGELIFQRTNIPDVVWLILAGIVLGPVFHIVTREMLQSVAPYFAALTLVVVLFEGGSALKLSDLRHTAPRSGVLALATFSASLGAMVLLSLLFGFASDRMHDSFGIARFLPPEWGVMHGVLLGAILGGSSSIILMPAMAAARVEPRIANLANLESAVTDALCVVGSAAVIDIMLGATSAGASGPAMALIRSFSIGAGLGLVAGIIWLLFLRVLRDHQHAYPFTLSALLVLYVVIDMTGGSAAFGILTVALILGNARSIGKSIGLNEDVELDIAVRGFHHQMAFIIKSFFFVFIGAMLGPPWGGVLLGIALGIALFAVRLPAVKAALIGAGLSKAQERLVAVALPRGMAAGVLATLPVAKGVPGTESFPVIVFSAVFTTILIFAVGFPLAKRALTPDADGVGAASMPAGAALPMDMAERLSRLDSVPPPNSVVGAARRSVPPGSRPDAVSERPPPARSSTQPRAEEPTEGVEPGASDGTDGRA